MVQWKGEITEKAGQKAELLDQLEGFNVPNFFVIEPEEVNRLFKSENDPEAVLNTSINRTMKREIKEAYDEVGMSSEVREASGKAKSLVGGQRNSQLISIRVSGSEKEKYTYKLNVGSSNFFESLREVVSSYYQENSDNPAILVQKMVEPGYTGVLESKGREAILEAVSGLGISLEEGLTKSHVYHLRNSRIQKSFSPDEQLEISRNPVRGENQRQKVKDEEPPFDQEEVEELARKGASSNVDLKFVYKRGGFHVVDAYQSSDDQRGFIVSEKGVRASRGEINGVVGENITFSSQTVSPEDYADALVASKGGYTSRDGYRAREAGKPAVFRFEGKLDNGVKVKFGSAQVEPSKEDAGNSGLSVNSSSGERSAKSGRTGRDRTEGSNPFRTQEESSESFSEEVLATEVLPIDPRRGRGVFLKRKGSEGYSVADRSTDAVKIPEEGYLSSFEDVFAAEEDAVVLDARRLPDRGMVEAVRYLEADTRVLLVKNPERELLQQAVESGFDAIGCPDKRVSKVSEVVAGIEKKFIMEKLREL